MGPVWGSLRADYRDRLGNGPARELADRVGFPLVVKPNAGSKGRGVSRVDDFDQLDAAIDRVFEFDTLALAQRWIPGRDFRVDFLDGEFLIGYERVGIRVEGDGRANIAELVARSDIRFRDQRTIDAAEADEAWERHVVSNGWTRTTILEPGSVLDFGSDVLNLGRLATARIIENLPDDIREMGSVIGKTLGLRYWGVDFRAPELATNEAYVIEVNCSPLLEQVYRMGHEELVLESQVRVLERVVASSQRDDLT